jgi:hypothetical protein
MSGRQNVLEIELRRTRRAKWLMLPATLPLSPDRLRVRLLEQVQRLRQARAVPRTGSPSYDFDESALRIAPGVWPSVNLVAVARR